MWLDKNDTCFHFRVVTGRGWWEDSKIQYDKFGSTWLEWVRLEFIFGMTRSQVTHSADGWVSDENQVEFATFWSESVARFCETPRYWRKDNASHFLQRESFPFFHFTYDARQETRVYSLIFARVLIVFSTLRYCCLVHYHTSSSNISSRNIDSYLNTSYSEWI